MSVSRRAVLLRLVALLASAVSHHKFNFFFVGVSVLCMIKSFDIMQKICTTGYMLLVDGDSRYKLSHQNFFSANHPMLIEFYLFLHLKKWRELTRFLRFWKD